MGPAAIVSRVVGVRYTLILLLSKPSPKRSNSFFQNISFVAAFSLWQAVKKPANNKGSYFRISSLWCALVSEGRYRVQELVTFGEQTRYIKLVGLSYFYGIKDGNSYQQFLKHQSFPSGLNRCCCHKGGIFMSRPCCQWSTGKPIRFRCELASFGRLLRLDHQQLFGKGARAPPPKAGSSRGGTRTWHERAAEIEPNVYCN